VTDLPLVGWFVIAATVMFAVYLLIWEV